MAQADSVPSLLAEQERRNRQAQGNWDLFADHRRRVTDLLVAAARDSGGDAPRLCVLGAGNVNDLELATILGCFSRVHLVDWDTEALASGIERQGCTGNPAVICRGGIDLTGVGTSPDLPIEQYLGRIRSAPPPAISEKVEVVASICVLSQLLEAAARLGTEHPRYLDAVQAIRLRHLQILVEMLAPGGIGLLICDVVSSDTLPQLLTAQEVEIPTLLTAALEQKNFFTGLNPAVVLSLFAQDPLLCQRIARCEPVAPWRWNLGPRVYAVYGIRFRCH
jgi:hypothetical protein